MGDGWNSTKGKTSKESFLLHSANGPHLYNRGVINDLGIRRPAGERNVCPSQELDRRLNELGDAKPT